MPGKGFGHDTVESVRHDRGRHAAQRDDSSVENLLCKMNPKKNSGQAANVSP